MGTEELKQDLSRRVDNILNTYRKTNVNVILENLNSLKNGFEDYYNLTGDPVFASRNAGRCSPIIEYIERNNWKGEVF